jgi:hypothetical protein
MLPCNKRLACALKVSFLFVAILVLAAVVPALVFSGYATLAIGVVVIEVVLSIWMFGAMVNT